MAGILFACMVADPERRRGLDNWYDREHLPGRMTVPGFLRANRYREISDDPVRATACVYELESEAVLQSEAYLALQARTHEDTAAHLEDLQRMWRLVGTLCQADGEQPPQEPAPIVVAALAAPAAVKLAEGHNALRTRRFSTTWDDAPCELSLFDLAEPPAGNPVLQGPADAWWLLERVW